jgi:hypothetical protein
MVEILYCGVTACWDLSSEYRSRWFFDLPGKLMYSDLYIFMIDVNLHVCICG